MNVTSDGAAYKEVPLIITDVYQDSVELPVIESSTPIKEKNDSLKKRVQDLYEQGMDSEQIASQVSCSVTEVEMIIAML